jgi:hypothetical protein
MISSKGATTDKLLPLHWYFISSANLGVSQNLTEFVKIFMPESLKFL